MSNKTINGNGKSVYKRTPAQIAAQFKPGNRIGVGRKRGKQKIAGKFLDDLSKEWESRGAQVLADLDGKLLVQAMLAVMPKDVLVSVDRSDKVQWLISSDPVSNEIEWKERHGLRDDSVTIDQDKPVDSSG